MHRRTALFVSLLFPAFAFAHGDVGNGLPERLIHVLGSTDHLVVLPVLAATWLFIRHFHRRLRRFITRAARQIGRS